MASSSISAQARRPRVLAPFLCTSLWLVGCGSALDGQPIAFDVERAGGDRPPAVAYVAPFQSAGRILAPDLASLEQTFLLALRKTGEFSEVTTTTDAMPVQGDRLLGAGLREQRGVGRKELRIQGTVVEFIHKSHFSQSWFFIPAALVVPVLAAPLAVAPAEIIHEANFLTLKVSVSAPPSAKLLLVAQASSHGDCLSCVVENVNSRLVDRIVNDAAVRAAIDIPRSDGISPRAPTDNRPQPRNSKALRLSIVGGPAGSPHATTAHREAQRLRGTSSRPGVFTKRSATPRRLDATPVPDPMPGGERTGGARRL